jgi:hypothetical protein
VEVAQVLFCSGEAMTPEGIRAAFPEGRFIARGSVQVDATQVPEPFRTVVDGEVWGVAIQIDGDRDGLAATVTLDDGRQLEAVVAEPHLGGDPAAVLANARYWESPPAFVDRLASVVPIADEE